MFVSIWKYGYVGEYPATFSSGPDGKGRLNCCIQAEPLGRARIVLISRHRRSTAFLHAEVMLVARQLQEDPPLLTLQGTGLWAEGERFVSVASFSLRSH